MPLNPALFYSNFNKIHGFKGDALPMILSAVATGTYTWVTTTGLATQSKCAGSLGTGNIKGKISCPPPIIPDLVSLAKANGLDGDAAPALVASIAMGFMETMNTALYSGVSPTVGAGAEVLTVVVPDISGLQSNILSNFPKQGKATPQFCMAIAQVIAKISLTCIGTGVIAPTGAITPASGLGSGINITIF